MISTSNSATGTTAQTRNVCFSEDEVEAEKAILRKNKQQLTDDIVKECIEAVESLFGVLLAEELTHIIRVLLGLGIDVDNKDCGISSLENNSEVIPSNVAIKPTLTTTTRPDDTATSKNCAKLKEEAKKFCQVARKIQLFQANHDLTI